MANGVPEIPVATAGPEEESGRGESRNSPPPELFRERRIRVLSTTIPPHREIPEGSDCVERLPGLLPNGRRNP
jgi:hypothetical protein